MARDNNYIELDDCKSRNMATASSSTSQPPAATPSPYSDSPNDLKAGATPSETQLEITPTKSPLRDEIAQQPTYRVYKRRFFGLFQLVLLNIIVSWDWLTFAAVSDTSAHFFNVSSSAINWLSTGFLFAFVVAAPAALWVLNRYGPKTSILVASALVLVGNWIRYAGARSGSHGNYGVVLLGQMLIGLAQPFVLAAPTRYSDMWFSDQGRVAATAVASLANPFGGALGQLIGPFWATEPSAVPSMLLYTSVLSALATLPALFISARPPTPPSAVGAATKLHLRAAFRQLHRNGSFFLLLLPFSIYVGFFNATSSLITQIFEPYGFSEDDSGIAGGILIVVGLIASAIVSPLIDRTKAYLITIKILVPLIAISYTILIFMPQTRTIAGPYIVCALLGATSFSLLPAALELLSIVTFPVSPEVSSVIAWTGGQILGAIFIIVMDALRGGWKGEPDDSMTRALIFQDLIAWVAVPFPLLLGVWKFRKIIIGHETPLEQTGGL